MDKNKQNKCEIEKKIIRANIYFFPYQLSQWIAFKLS